MTFQFGGKKASQPPAPQPEVKEEDVVILAPFAAAPASPAEPEAKEADVVSGDLVWPPGLVVKIQCPDTPLHGLKAVTQEGDQSRGLVPVKLLKPPDGVRPVTKLRRPKEPEAHEAHRNSIEGLDSDLHFLKQGPRSLDALRPSLLETVLPKFGNKVLVLRPGDPDPPEGTLQSVETDTFTCTVLLDDGQPLKGLPYDQVCKIWAG